MTPTASSSNVGLRTLDARLQEVLDKGLLDAPFPGPRGGWTVARDEHDRSQHAYLVAGPEGGEPLKISVRIDAHTRRLVVSFYSHRSHTDSVGRHTNIYARDLFTLTEWNAMVREATVAPDANATRIAGAVRKVLPAALKAFEVLEEWSWRVATRAVKRDRATAAVRVATGANLTPHASREEVSAYLPEGSPLQRMLGPYVQVVVDSAGDVTFTGVRINGDNAATVLAALNEAATNYLARRG